MTVIERTPVRAAISRPEYQVTEWGLPHEAVLTFIEKDHRPVRYDRYLHGEIERWQATNGREAWVLQNPGQVKLADGYVAERGEAIALFSWREYQKPVEE